MHNGLVHQGVVDPSPTVQVAAARWAWLQRAIFYTCGRPVRCRSTKRMSDCFVVCLPGPENPARVAKRSLNVDGVQNCPAKFLTDRYVAPLL